MAKLPQTVVMVSTSAPLYVFNAASQTIILYFGGKRCKKLTAGYEAIYFQSLIADVLYRALFLFVPVIKHSWVITCDAHKTKHLAKPNKSQMIF